MCGVVRSLASFSSFPGSSNLLIIFPFRPAQPVVLNDCRLAKEGYGMWVNLNIRIFHNKLMSISIYWGKESNSLVVIVNSHLMQKFLCVLRKPPRRSCSVFFFLKSYWYCRCMGECSWCWIWLFLLPPGTDSNQWILTLGWEYDLWMWWAEGDCACWALKARCFKCFFPLGFWRSSCAELWN